MTVLAEFERLECTGLWRAGPGAQRREVIVALGNATLVLSDGRSGAALSHWSLPAVARVNPGQRPALYRPSPDAEEDLEIEDAAMIGAIGKVHAALAARLPHPGRLRGGLLVLALVAVLAAAVLWLPGAMVRQAARAAPVALRAEVGQLALADVTRIAGQPCAGPRGQRALDALYRRLLPQGTGGILVLPEALAGSAHLPGGIILLGRSVVEIPETPEVAAGYVLAEALRALRDDPMERLLRGTGPLGALRLLTRGALRPADVAGQAEGWLAAAPAPLPDADLIAAFRAAGVASTPYALALDPTGEASLPLIEADPMAGRTAAPLLADDDWLSMQAICDGA